MSSVATTPARRSVGHDFLEGIANGLGLVPERTLAVEARIASARMDPRVSRLLRVTALRAALVRDCETLRPLLAVRDGCDHDQRAADPLVVGVGQQLRLELERGPGFENVAVSADRIGKRPVSPLGADRQRADVVGSVLVLESSAS